MNTMPQQQQRGIGLIEILVAVVLIAVGFLASARMQVQGMRFSQSAYFESQAYFLANDMIERMRANYNGIRDSEYASIDTRNGVNNPNCNAAFCTPAQQAMQDAFDWSVGFTGNDDTDPLLPGDESNTAFGTVVESDPGVYDVSVTWYEVINQSVETQTRSFRFVPEQEL